MSAGLLLLCTLLPGQTDAASIRHQVTGLFSPERVTDLHETMKSLPDIKLISVDFRNAEAVFEYAPAKAFPNVKSDQVVKQFDTMLRSASKSTFGIRPLRTVSGDKLANIEIAVAGCDCKGCCLAAYEAVMKVEGVEQATVSFRDGRVTALIDPAKVERAALEEALKKKGVTLK